MMSDKFSLSGKIAVVTGGGMGIGKAVALGFADMGADVIIVDKDEIATEKTVLEIKRKGQNGLGMVADVRSGESVTKVVKNVDNQFGRIDILVNNAGGMFTANISEITEGGWDAIIRANLKSTFVCSKAVSSLMMEKKTHGSIINIASIHGLCGSPKAAAYGAAKAAVINLTQSLAMELASFYIRVNAIAPGIITTPGTEQWKTPERKEKIARQVPLSRSGTPEDIAGTAIYLASNCADYVTGQTLVVDGGMMATPRVP